MNSQAAQAFARFGLGRRGEEPTPADPSAWLLGQLRQPDPARISPEPTAAEGLAALRFDRRDKPPPGESHALALFRAQAAAELDNALITTAPFRERLVWFWTNHFTISIRRGICAPLAAAFVEEAIRPYVTGRFSDMVLAVMRHPAMLIYLDNTDSISPDSPVGMRSHRGLNENLARECMELHTVSPAAGYTQADVTALARVLTGWSVEMNADPLGFRFKPAAHEIATQTVMGRRFDPDQDGGIAALSFLADHPSTHRFLATKLTRHFVADDPPPADVRRIESILRDTRGDLQAAAAGLVSIDAAWVPGTKLRTPLDFVVAGMRALDLPANERPNPQNSIAILGQPLWTAPAPNGWPDQAADWVTPEAMLRRIDWAYGFAGHIGTRDPTTIAEASLGPFMRPATVEALKHAGSRRDAMTMLLTSPEFQRR
jgi:uncharacterized protein (DUF1800 family)